jgi:excisionase family DNA binding protein
LPTHRALLDDEAAVTIAEAVLITRLSRSTIERLIRTEKLPARRVGRRVLIATDDLKTLLGAA